MKTILTIALIALTFAACGTDTTSVENDYNDTAVTQGISSNATAISSVSAQVGENSSTIGELQSDLNETNGAVSSIALAVEEIEPLIVNINDDENITNVIKVDNNYTIVLPDTITQDGDGSFSWPWELLRSSYVVSQGKRYWKKTDVNSNCTITTFSPVAIMDIGARDTANFPVEVQYWGSGLYATEINASMKVVTFGVELMAPGTVQWRSIPENCLKRPDQYVFSEE